MKSLQIIIKSVGYERPTKYEGDDFRINVDNPITFIPSARYVLYTDKNPDRPDVDIMLKAIKHFDGCIIKVGECSYLIPVSYMAYLGIIDSPYWLYLLSIKVHMMHANIVELVNNLAPVGSDLNEHNPQLEEFISYNLKRIPHNDRYIYLDGKFTAIGDHWSLRSLPNVPAPQYCMYGTRIGFNKTVITKYQGLPTLYNRPIRRLVKMEEFMSFKAKYSMYRLFSKDSQEYQMLREWYYDGTELPKEFLQTYLAILA